METIKVINGKGDIKEISSDTPKHVYQGAGYELMQKPKKLPDELKVDEESSEANSAKSESKELKKRGTRNKRKQ